MRKNVRLELWSIFWIAVISFFFILFSYLVQTNLDFFERFIVSGVFGMVVYVFLNVVATVVAPVTVLPLIVLATGLWGVVASALLSVLGWAIGGAIAFWLARRFGVPLVSKFISLKGIYRIQDKVKVGNTFWSVVFLRMVVPVDVLSYALGLFSRIGFWKYFLATVIGIMPLAFVFAYLGKISYIYQVVLGLVFLIGFLGYLIFQEIKKRRV